MAKTLDEQIEKLQKQAWELADECDNDQMKNKDRIFHSGLVMEETECLMKLFNDDSDENKKDYLLLLNEMKRFYTKISKQQQVLV